MREIFRSTEVTDVDEMAYVRILRDLREDADKTQTQIAEVLGTSQTMYARYERGANELPIHHLINLSMYVIQYIFHVILKILKIFVS